jgi:hypothetical protein
MRRTLTNAKSIGNFNFDYQAHSTVKRNFDRLIKLGHLNAAMELALI